MSLGLLRDRINGSQAGRFSKLSMKALFGRPAELVERLRCPKRWELHRLTPGIMQQLMKWKENEKSEVSEKEDPRPWVGLGS